jgi:hypothetical protein
MSSKFLITRDGFPSIRAILIPDSYSKRLEYIQGLAEVVVSELGCDPSDLEIHYISKGIRHKNKMSVEASISSMPKNLLDWTVVNHWDIF